MRYHSHNCRNSTLEYKMSTRTGVANEVTKWQLRSSDAIFTTLGERKREVAFVNGQKTNNYILHFIYTYIYLKQERRDRAREEGKGEQR